MPKKTAFLYALLFVLVLPAVSKAADILYCSSELAPGIIKGDNGIWREGSFMQKRFTVKFNDDFTELSGIRYDTMTCNQSSSSRPQLVFCTSHDADAFIYDKNTRRFIYSDISAFGYPTNQTDTSQIYAGTCEDF